MIRPSSSSATQASASPRGDSAQPRPAPPPGRERDAVRRGAAVKELRDQPDRFGCLAEHHLEAREHVAAVGGDDADGMVGVGPGSCRGGRQPGIGDQPGGARDRPDQAEAAGLLGGQDPAGFQPVDEGVGAQQRVGGAAQLTVGAGQFTAERAGVRCAADSAWLDDAEQVPVAERGGVDSQQPLEGDLGGGLAHRKPGGLAQCRRRGGMVVQAFELERDRPGPRGRGRRRDAERGFRRRRERPADGDGAEAFGALGEEDGLGQGLAASAAIPRRGAYAR